MFDIISGSFGDHAQYRLVNTQSGEYLSVIPDTGGLVRELVLKGSDQAVPVLSGYHVPEQLQDLRGYRNCRLLPFPNRIAGAEYTFQGTGYKLPVNREKEGCAIHGLFYDSKFGVSRCISGAGEARIDLVFHYDGGIRGYPFPIDIFLSYTLSTGGFRSDIRAVNTGNEAMPFGDGWHPYLTLDDSPGAIERYTLKLPGSKLVCLDDHKMPTGEYAEFNRFRKPAPLKYAVFDDCLELDAARTAVTEIRDRVTGSVLSLWQQAGPGAYRYLQVYTPPGRESIAIEPMTCAPNAFNNGMGLIRLDPGEAFAASFGISLSGEL